MVLTTLVILAILRASGVHLTLFHLISLVLAAGLGLDYALFFEHAADDAADQQRTLHALMVCSPTTLLVFALLSFSTSRCCRPSASRWRSACSPTSAGAAVDARTGPHMTAKTIDIGTLLPHAGTARMIERVVEWDRDSIVTATARHRAADNPLRKDGRLAAVHLAEFGAQTMAFMADC